MWKRPATRVDQAQSVVVGSAGGEETGINRCSTLLSPLRSRIAGTDCDHG